MAIWPSVALPLKKSNHFRGRNKNMVILQRIKKKGKRDSYFCLEFSVCPLCLCVFHMKEERSNRFLSFFLIDGVKKEKKN
jgi:hypothetical protein